MRRGQQKPSHGDRRRGFIDGNMIAVGRIASIRPIEAFSGLGRPDVPSVLRSTLERAVDAKIGAFWHRSATQSHRRWDFLFCGGKEGS